MNYWATIRLISYLFATQHAYGTSRHSSDQNEPNSDLTGPIKLTVSVIESESIEQVVANLSALLLTDRDHVNSFINQELRTRRLRPAFELLDVSANLMSNLHPPRRLNFLQLVQLDSQTGLIRFTVPLDRERLCPDVLGTDQRCTISLLIAVHLRQENDTKQAAHTVYVDLTVIVQDVNDNAPYFPNANLAENSQHHSVLSLVEECPVGTMIALPQATDSDSIEHGVQRYEFHPTATPAQVRDLFDIVQFRYQSGTRCEDLVPSELERLASTTNENDHGTVVVPCLRVRRRLDRETAGKQFQFRLVAVDTDGKRGETQVQLYVRDINDHAPEWPAKLERFDASGRALWVEATQQQDETGDSKKTQYSFTVPECTTQHKLIRLEARDLDDPEQDAGRISYRLSDHQLDTAAGLRRRFFISNNHVYLTDRGLRGWTQPNVTLVVVASDAAGKSSEAWFHLLIEDCNDHRPVILMQNTDYISIPEEYTGTSHLISLITVRDFDLVSSPNSEFSCFLNDTTYLELREVVTGPTVSAAQDVSSGTHSADVDLTHVADSGLTRRGRWSVYRLGSRPDVSFDRESTAFYTVMFQCVDKGVPPLSATRQITIHVEDVNDNAPRFVVDCSSSNGFPFGSHANTMMRANSQDRSCSTQFEFKVPESAERGALIGSVRAVDPDTGENARISYNLIRDATSPDEKQQHSPVANSSDPDSVPIDTLFTVSPLGELHLIGELDRERTSQYRFLVQAADHGKPVRLSSTATVVVNVEDANDCAPVFHGDYVYEVVESYGSSTIHQLLGALNATDMDLGRNGTINYRLAPSPTEKINSGQINANSKPPIPGSQLVKVTHDGQVTIYGVVDREETPIIMVDVIAEDNGFPVRLSTLATVTIHVLDLNDNKPRFVQLDSGQPTRQPHRLTATNPSRDAANKAPGLFDPMGTEATYKLNLSLDTGVGTLLTKFAAIDPDDGRNGTVVFELIYSGGQLSSRVDLSDAEVTNRSLPTFTLHPDGRLILTNQLEFDTIYAGASRHPRRYRRPDHLLIRASDQGPVPEHAITGLQIVYHDATEVSADPVRDLRAKAAGQIAAANFTTFVDALGARADLSEAKHSYQSEYAHQEHKQHKPSKQQQQKQQQQALNNAKPHGLPVLYLLALAVCFALVLVISSLIYLYFKMRRSGTPDQSNKLNDPSNKPDPASVKFLNSDNAPNGAMRMECNLRACLGSGLPDDASNTSRQTNSLFPLGESARTSAVTYHTLSSPYLMLNASRLSPTLTGDSYANEVAHAHWASVSSGYMDSRNVTPPYAIRPSPTSHSTHPTSSTLFYPPSSVATSQFEVSGTRSDREDQRMHRLLHHSLPKKGTNGVNAGPDKSIVRAKQKCSTAEKTMTSFIATSDSQYLSKGSYIEDSSSGKDFPGPQQTELSSSDCTNNAEVQTTPSHRHVDGKKVSETSTPLLLFLDRQRGANTPIRTHVTGGSFV